jgi:Ca2+-binding RTX toxin-like protein
MRIWGESRRLSPRSRRLSPAAVALACVVVCAAGHAASGAQARGASDLIAFHNGFNLDIHLGPSAPPDAVVDVRYDAGLDELFIVPVSGVSIEPQGSCSSNGKYGVRCPPALGITVYVGGGSDLVILPSDPEAKDHAYLTIGISTHGGHDRIEAGVGNDVIRAGASRDLLNGSLGNDRLVGGTGNDRTLGGAGDDTLVGGSGVDNFSGSRGDDVLRTRDGRRDGSIKCGPGDDRVVMDVGIDHLSRHHGCERPARR